MKKISIIIIAIMLITSLLFVFAGCGESFSKNSIMAQINNNLGWHEGGKEVCKYDVTKDGVKIGEYVSVMESLFNQNVEITTSNESIKPALSKFTGYKFTSTMTAELDGKKFVKETQSYASHKLEPKLSYVKTVEESSLETITVYEEKKTNVTFIKDGATFTDSAKYSKSAFVVDNSFLYQFARATTLSASLSIVVPTYNSEKNTTQNASFSCSYASATNIVLKTTFVLEKSFSETINSGEQSGEITSGTPVNSGTADNSGDITTSEADESGNVTITYPHTVTSNIPVVKCTFTTAKTFPASGSISCMISTAPMKMQGDSRFVRRVVTRFQEDDIIYDLNYVNYTL